MRALRKKSHKNFKYIRFCWSSEVPKAHWLVNTCHMTCKCPIVSYAWFQSIVHSNHALKFLPPGARLYCHMSNVMWTSKLTSLFLRKTHLLNSNHQNGHLHNFEMIGVVHYTYCRDMTNSNENDIVAFLIFDICDLSWQQTNISSVH